MNRILVLTLFVCVPAVDAQAGKLATDAKVYYDGVKNFVLRSAEKMPEEKYSFKPVDTVRSFGQILGHIADAQYLLCSAPRGEKAPPQVVEKTKTTKAELIQALKDSFAYCDAAYADLSDAKAVEIVKFFNNDRARISVLTFNTGHTFEHYGNLITYLRINGIVPPSSDRQ